MVGLKLDMTCPKRNLFNIKHLRRKFGIQAASDGQPRRMSTILHKCRLASGELSENRHFTAMGLDGRRSFRKMAAACNHEGYFFSFQIAIMAGEPWLRTLLSARMASVAARTSSRGKTRVVL